MVAAFAGVRRCACCDDSELRVGEVVRQCRESIVFPSADRYSIATFAFDVSRFVQSLVNA